MSHKKRLKRKQIQNIFKRINIISLKKQKVKRAFLNLKVLKKKTMFAKKVLYLSFSISGDKSLTRALQSNKFQNLRGVA